MKQSTRRLDRAALSAASLLFVLLAGRAIADAQAIYRWTDDRGVVHFGNSPPKRGAEERLTVRPLVAEPAEENAPSEAEPLREEDAPPEQGDPPAAPEPQVILDNDENALVGASVQHFSGRVKNLGSSVARDVAVEILVFDESVGDECIRSSATVSPEVLAPGATGTYAVDLQSPCFAAGTRADVRARWN